MGSPWAQAPYSRFDHPNWQTIIPATSCLLCMPIIHWPFLPLPVNYSLTIWPHQISLISHSIMPEVYPGVENFKQYSKLELPNGQKRKIKEWLKHYVKDSFCVDLIATRPWIPFCWSPHIPQKKSKLSCDLFVFKLASHKQHFHWPQFPQLHLSSSIPVAMVVIDTPWR